MKNGIFIIGIVFAATLAYVVGNRLSAEAMAVAVGAVCGIGASVPVSVALYIAASRNWGKESGSELGAEPGEYAGYAGYAEYRGNGARSYPPHGQAPHAYAPPPQYVVISSPQPQMPYPFPGSQLYLPPQAPAQGAPREFKIIGEE